MLSFESLWCSLLPPVLYFGIHLVEGETLTPLLLARRFTLNPVLIILSLVFWFWMWGVLGAILAVPMLAILKIVCAGCARLRPWGISSKGNSDVAWQSPTFRCTESRPRNTGGTNAVGATW
jgi:predicted PurR-regulated permease PerM